MGRCGVYLMLWYSYLCFCTYYFQEYRLFYTISSTDFLPEDFSLDIKSAQPTKCRSLELPWSQCLRATPTQKYTASFPLEQTIISHRICTQQVQRAIARLHSSCPQQQVTNRYTLLASFPFFSHVPTSEPVSSRSLFQRNYSYLYFGFRVSFKS